MSKSSASSRSERAVRYKADLFEVVNKLYDEGMTYAQIAEHMSITVSAVKAKIRGRQRNEPRGDSNG